MHFDLMMESAIVQEFTPAQILNTNLFWPWDINLAFNNLATQSTFFLEYVRRRAAHYCIK